MTVKAIIEMMDRLGFSDAAKHKVSYDLLESSLYTPIDREGSPLSKVLDMVNVKEILENTPLDSYERISPTILSGIVNKFAKYPLLNADNIKMGLVIHYKGGRYLSLYLNDLIKTNFGYWQNEGIRIAEKLKELTGNVWEIHIHPCGGDWYTIAYQGETLLGVSRYPVEAFPDNIRCVQYKEIVDYNSDTYIPK